MLEFPVCTNWSQSTSKPFYTQQIPSRASSWSRQLGPFSSAWYHLPLQADQILQHTRPTVQLTRPPNRLLFFDIPDASIIILMNTPPHLVPARRWTQGHKACCMTTKHITAAEHHTCWVCSSSPPWLFLDGSCYQRMSHSPFKQWRKGHSMDKHGVRKGIVFVFLLLFTFTYCFPNPKQPSMGIPMLPFLPACLLQGTPAPCSAKVSSRLQKVSHHVRNTWPLPLLHKGGEISLMSGWNLSPAVPEPHTGSKVAYKKSLTITFFHYLQIPISKLKTICCKMLETQACYDSFAKALQENSVEFHLCEEPRYSYFVSTSMQFFWIFFLWS